MGYGGGGGGGEGSELLLRGWAVRVWSGGRLLASGVGVWVGVVTGVECGGQVDGMYGGLCWALIHQYSV